MQPQVKYLMQLVNYSAHSLLSFGHHLKLASLSRQERGKWQNCSVVKRIAWIFDNGAETPWRGSIFQLKMHCVTRRSRHPRELLCDIGVDSDNGAFCKHKEILIKRQRWLTGEKSRWTNTKHIWCDLGGCPLFLLTSSCFPADTVITASQRLLTLDGGKFWEKGLSASNYRKCRSKLFINGCFPRNGKGEQRLTGS